MDTAFPAVDEFGTLIDVLLAGDHAAALAETQRLIQAGHPAEKIVTAGLETAMRRLDDKCTVESFNLLEIMLVGRAVSAVVHELYPEGVPPENSRGTLIVAATAREAASGVLISGLISSIVPQVRRVRPALRTHGLGSVWVVAGGAALKQCAAADLDVDYVAENAFDGARYIEARFTGATP